MIVARPAPVALASRDAVRQQLEGVDHRLAPALVRPVAARALVPQGVEPRLDPVSDGPVSGVIERRGGDRRVAGDDARGARSASHGQRDDDRRQQDGMETTTPA